MTCSSALRARKNPSQKRSQALVEAIVEAAGCIIRQDGVDGVTTGAVARLAGVSIGSLYQYFSNREAIVTEVADRHRILIEAVIGGGFASVAAFVAGMFEAHAKDAALSVALSQSAFWPQPEFIARLSGRLDDLCGDEATSDDTVSFVIARAVDALAIAAAANATLPDGRIQRETIRMITSYLNAAGVGVADQISDNASVTSGTLMSASGSGNGPVHRRLMAGK